MASSVDICNMALSHVGANFITSLNDNTTEAKICAAQYDFSRDFVLGEREWTFAISRKELAASANAPIFGFDNNFKLPSDTIRVVEAFDKADMSSGIWSYRGEGNNSLYWQREGEYIAADAEILLIRYLVRVEDPNRYTPGFVQALAAHLAYKIAIPLTKSRSLQSDMYQLYQDTLNAASTGDGLQGRNKTIRSSRLVNVRAR